MIILLQHLIIIRLRWNGGFEEEIFVVSYFYFGYRLPVILILDRSPLRYFSGFV